jgi:hypothetical protein
MKTEMSDLIARFRDQTIKHLGFPKGSPEEKLITSMTNAIYTEGAADGMKSVIKLLKMSFGKTPAAEQVFNEILLAFEVVDKENENLIKKTLDEQTIKN